MDLFQDLNPPQREAVTHPGGPLLILAGAGSGKTRVLAYRVAYLLRHQSIAPARILAVTFTNKAANEMRERVDRLVGTAVARAIWIGTFHHICSRILRRNGDRVGGGRNFLLVDEYQDTNRAQYLIIRTLAEKHRNICVVGDDDQCLPAGTLVTTSRGVLPIESLDEELEVASACGGGRVTFGTAAPPVQGNYAGPVITIRTRGGLELTTTPNHLVFGRLVPRPDLHYVYLMHKRGLGYRIGRTRGVRSRSVEEVDSGLALRLNGEAADRLWVLAASTDETEIACLEQLYAFTYGIPTTVFHVRGRRMKLRQGHVDRIYHGIDTEPRAERLLTDLGMLVDYPHHRSSAVVRGQTTRRLVHFTMFGDNRTYAHRAWADNRIQMVTSGDALRQRVALEFSTRPSRELVWRVGTAREGHDAGRGAAPRLRAAVEGEPGVPGRPADRSRGRGRYQPL